MKTPYKYRVPKRYLNGNFKLEIEKVDNFDEIENLNENRYNDDIIRSAVLIKYKDFYYLGQSRDNDNTLMCFGGKRNEGETIEDNIKRELFEESYNIFTLNKYWKTNSHFYRTHNALLVVCEVDGFLNPEDIEMLSYECFKHKQNIKANLCEYETIKIMNYTKDEILDLAYNKKVRNMSIFDLDGEMIKYHFNAINKEKDNNDNDIDNNNGGLFIKID